jgi:hypothetical protein
LEPELFHPPARKATAVAHRATAVACGRPALILQREVDSIGSREVVQTSSIFQDVLLRLNPSGGYGFKSTRSTALSEADNWAKSLTMSDQFLRVLFRG